MTISKPTSDSVMRRMNVLSELRAKRERASRMHIGSSSEFWKDLKSLLEESIKNQSYIIERAFMEKPESVEAAWGEAKKAFGARMQAQAIIDLVERPDDFYYEIDARIKNLEEKIREAESSGILEREA